MSRGWTAITLAAIIALELVPSGAPARAAQGFDAAYAGESAFVTLRPGQTAAFAVFFQNTGTTTWVAGTSTEVILAACLDDKVTCHVWPEEVAWAFNWRSQIAYTRQLQSSVGPGQLATFSYEVRAPLTATSGRYRFNGDLALASTLAMIHPEGYYHDVVLLPAPTPVPTATPSPTPTPVPASAGGSAPAATAAPTPPPPPPPLPPPPPPPPPPAGP